MLNFRKVTKFQRVNSKALRALDKNLTEVPKESPGLNRVKFHFLSAVIFLDSNIATEVNVV